MRGEHDDAPVKTAYTVGSSPHARGALHSLAQAREVPGIIPACAGSTRRSCCQYRPTQDHPRMRGEHVFTVTEVIPSEGSSPHARGAQVREGACRLRGGIIPACAGSTRLPTRRRASSRDHPRMRGEHAFFGQPTTVSIGSSPHARGAPEAALGQNLGIGIIPACAGSTAFSRSPCVVSRDHPRMRGEHSTDMVPVSTHIGSSPHARGARAHMRSTSGFWRIIPACAGSTLSPSRGRRTWRDHPRMRGEHDARCRVP